MKLSNSLLDLNITDALHLLKKKEISAKELTQAHLDKIQHTNAELNAFVTVTAELALKQADASDQRIANGEALPLDGIPIGVKDLFCTTGIKTQAGSKMLQDFTPNYESTVTKNLYKHGAICIGKTNMDEFAMGSTNEYSYYGPVVNNLRDATKPDQKLVPGGSSGGSAVAVSAKMCLGSLGSDTGGSIRQPAAFCGIVGFKPSYGVCSRNGMIAFASSLDQAGVFSRSVKDSALILQAIAGYDVMDSTSAKRQYDFTSFDKQSVKGMKIGIPAEYSIDGIDTEILNAWKDAKSSLKERGAEIVDITLPNTRAAIAVYLILAPAEMSANLSRYDGARFGFRASGDFRNYMEMLTESRNEGFGNEVRRRMLIGNFVLSSDEYEVYYEQAQKVRRLICNEFSAAFQNVDAILAPTTPTTAFPLNADSDPVKMYANDVLTTPASLAGLPAISVPFGVSNTSRLPLAMQIIGNRFCENDVLRVAQALEDSNAF